MVELVVTGGMMDPLGLGNKLLEDEDPIIVGAAKDAEAEEAELNDATTTEGVADTKKNFQGKDEEGEFK